MPFPIHGILQREGSRPQNTLDFDNVSIVYAGPSLPLGRASEKGRIYKNIIEMQVRLQWLLGREYNNRVREKCVHASFQFRGGHERKMLLNEFHSSSIVGD